MSNNAVISADYDNVKSAFANATPNQLAALRSFANLVIVPAPMIGASQADLIAYQKTWNNELTQLERILPNFSQAQQDAVMAVINYNNNLNLMPLPPAPPPPPPLPPKLSTLDKLKGSLSNELNKLKGDIGIHSKTATPEQKNAMDVYKNAHPGSPPGPNASPAEIENYQAKEAASHEVKQQALTSMTPTQVSLMQQYDQLVNTISANTKTNTSTAKYIVIALIILLIGIIGGMGFFIYTKMKKSSPTNVKFGKK